METTTKIVGSEVPLSSYPSERWMNGVIDLVKLTNQNKLIWKRVTDPSLWEDNYETVLKDKRIRLEIPSRRELTVSRLEFMTGKINPEPKPKKRVYPYLRIYSGLELAVSFPDMAPIDALLQAVDRQVEQTEYSILQDIHAQLET